MLESLALELFLFTACFISLCFAICFMVTPVTPGSGLRRYGWRWVFKLRHGAVSGVGVFLGSCDEKASASCIVLYNGAEHHR